MRIACGIVAILVLGGLVPGAASGQDAIDENLNPWAYCRSAGNVDFVAERYLGDGVPSALARAARDALGLADEMPDALLRAGLTWRCMDAKVWVCHVGANLPCWSKADTRRLPGEGARGFCRDHPDAQSIPMFASGRETVYEWRCRGDAPYIAKQVVDVDARGFPAWIWFPAAPPESPDDPSR
ncbi:MAG: hypothetical protein AB7O21_18350 [Gammaproteobacteria bacterium]